MQIKPLIFFIGCPCSHWLFRFPFYTPTKPFIRLQLLIKTARVWGLKRSPGLTTKSTQFQAICIIHLITCIRTVIHTHTCILTYAKLFVETVHGGCRGGFSGVHLNPHLRPNYFIFMGIYLRQMRSNQQMEPPFIHLNPQLQNSWIRPLPITTFSLCPLCRFSIFAKILWGVHLDKFVRMSTDMRIKGGHIKVLHPIKYGRKCY